jgi:hypothetical protein
MHSSIRSIVNVRSAIVNCICPECGGVIELCSNQFRCVGRCGKDWRAIWESQHSNGPKHGAATIVGNFARAGDDCPYED